MKKNSVFKSATNNRESFRFLAKNVKISNDTRKTGVNNNDLVIGPSGAGKTRGYIIPYILHSEESMIIADTKGNLCRQYGEYLRARGYDVKCVNFKDIEASDCGYNPLDFIRVKDGVVNDQDVMSVTEAMCPVQDASEPFWDNSAKMILSAMIAYVMERCKGNLRNLHTVCEVYRGAFVMGRNGRLELAPGLQTYCSENPTSAFALKMAKFNSVASADKCISSILMFINTALAAIDTETVGRFLSMKNRVNFSDFFERKTALFLNVSDNDRALDSLVNLLYTQALQTFINGADRLPESKMPIPVRFLLDDFSTNVRIPNFDNIISVIRSRDISVSLIIQSFSQLETLYGKFAAQTIKDNCEHWLFLGTLNVDTAAEIAKRLNVQLLTVLSMPLKDAYIIARGGKPMKVEKYDLEQDAVYKRLNAASRRKTPDASPESPAA